VSCGNCWCWLGYPREVSPRAKPALILGFIVTAAPFIPPFPEPRESLPGPFEIIRLLRGNILSGFLARSYQSECIPLHLLGRRMLIINTPELVREIFVLRDDIYGRKSHFMDRALAPVIGESLFINHGEAWRERREALTPALHPAVCSSRRRIGGGMGSGSGRTATRYRA
jgi:cytochrome P450